MSSTDQAYADKYWDMANAITGFAALQGVAFSISSTTKEMSAKLHELSGCILALVLTVSAYAFYLFAVRKLHQFHFDSVGQIGYGTQNRAILIYYARSIIISWFLFINILVIVGALWDDPGCSGYFMVRV